MPEAEIDGQWVPLQPLGTEGQGTTSWGEAYGVESYATSGVSVPIGFGFKSNIGAFTAITFDWGVRKTWTDHLDDVSGLYADRAVLLAGTRRDDGSPWLTGVWSRKGTVESRRVAARGCLAG
jgi:hypothetical protein